MKDYRVLEQPKTDISTCFAEFSIGVNDGELEDPSNPALVNATAIMEYIEPRLHRGDMRLGITIIPANWFVFNYTSYANKARRAIHVICNLGDCDWEGHKIDNEQRYGIWKQCVLEIAQSLMTFLSQDDAKIYFHGSKESSYIINKTS